LDRTKGREKRLIGAIQGVGFAFPADGKGGKRERDSRHLAVSVRYDEGGGFET